MASFQSVLFFQAFMVEEEDVSKSVMHHAFGEDPKKSFLWRFLSNFYVDEVIFWDGIEEDVCGGWGGGEERRRRRQVKSERLWCRTTFKKLGNVNKVSCLFTKVKEVRGTDEDTEEIINVISASKWLHFVLIHAPISKFKRNLAFGWLEFGKNSAKMD